MIEWFQFSLVSAAFEYKIMISFRLILRFDLHFLSNPGNWFSFNLRLLLNLLLFDSFNSLVGFHGLYIFFKLGLLVTIIIVVIRRHEIIESWKIMLSLHETRFGREHNIFKIFNRSIHTNRRYILACEIVRYE